MYFGYLDEADHTKAKNFTICGLTAIRDDSAAALSTQIERLRLEAGLKSTDTLKSAPQNLPEGFSRDKHRELKNEIVEAAKDHGVVFLGYAYFNPVSQNFDTDRNRLFGFNTLMGMFNKFLSKKKSVGTVTVDRLDLSKSSREEYKDGFAYLKEKFQSGNKFRKANPSPPDFSPLDKILSFSMTCEGASHFSCLNDILTGNLRYLVNGDKPDVRAVLQHKLSELMWRDGRGRYAEHGLTLRPKDRATLDPNLGIEYDTLRNFLNTNTLPPAP